MPKMLLPVFIVVGIVNLIANRVNYNIHESKQPDMDIRVRRGIDVQRIKDHIEQEIETNIEIPTEHNKKETLLDILKGTIDKRNSRQKRDNHELLDTGLYGNGFNGYNTGFNGYNERVNKNYGQKSKSTNLFTSLVRSLNLFSLTKSSTQTNYYRDFYPRNNNGHYDNKGRRVFRQNGYGYQTPSPVNYNNFYSPYNTNTINQYNGNRPSINYTTFQYGNNYPRNTTPYFNNVYNSNNGGNAYNGRNNTGFTNNYPRNTTPYFNNVYNSNNGGNSYNGRNNTGFPFNGYYPTYTPNGNYSNGNMQNGYNQAPNYSYNSQTFNSGNSVVPYNAIVNNEIPYKRNTYTSATYNPYYSNAVLPINGNNNSVLPINGNSSTVFPFNGNYSTVFPFNGNYSTVFPFNGNYSSNNGVTKTTTEAINIAEGCILCATFSCPVNQKRVGFKCVDINEYDDYE